MAVGGDDYEATRDALVNDGLLVKGKGRGGSVRRAGEPRREFSLDAQEGPPPQLFDEPRAAASLPFEAGENRKVAVKVIDDRGIESLRTLEVPA